MKSNNRIQYLLFILLRRNIDITLQFIQSRSSIEETFSSLRLEGSYYREKESQNTVSVSQQLSDTHYHARILSQVQICDYLKDVQQIRSLHEPVDTSALRESEEKFE